MPLRFRPVPLLALAAATSLGAPLPPAHAAPVSARTVQTLMGPVQEIKLKNGLTVLLKEQHAAPVVTWMVFFKVGSRNESAGATGSAHLLEHMMFKGTKTLGKGQVAQLLGRNGAEFNASTWTDWTNYFETYASDRLELGLTVEAARMRDALIKDSERQSEMTVVRNEMERGESSPGTLLYHQVTAEAYRSHPYHHPVIGWRSDVEGVSTAKLKAFYDTYYQPNNAVAVLVGDFKTAEAIPMIEKAFGAIPAGPTPPAVYTTEEPQLGERRFVLRRRGETTMVQLAYHIPEAAHADIPALIVADTILSSGASDRLTQALVETQLATSAWASAGVQRDPSLFRVHADLHPGVAPEKAEAALLAELKKLADAPVEGAELQKAKTLAEATTIYRTEGTEGLADYIGTYAAIGRWERGFEILEAIRKVTPADVQRVAKTYFTADNRTVGVYAASPDGPVPPPPVNAGSGKATANDAKVVPPARFAFETRPRQQRALTRPVERVLPNGMRVLVLPNRSTPTVALSGYVMAGSAIAPESQVDVPGAVAAMLERGTAKRDKLRLATDLESTATSLSVSGGTERASISGKFLSRNTDQAVEALAEMLVAPTFPATELEKLKAEWIAGLRQGEDDPGTHVERTFTQAIYPEGHPHRWRSLEASLQGTRALGRDALVAFHRDHYGPNATTLVFVGDVEPEKLFATLERAFAGWKPVALTPLPNPSPLPAKAQRLNVVLPDKTNVEALVGGASSLTRQSPDYFAAALANYVLGGGSLTSRLGTHLRDEQGLTYGVYTTFSPGKIPGPWRAVITLNPANLGAGLKGLDAEIRKFLAGGPSPQELSDAKSSFIGSQAVGLSTNREMAGSLNNIVYNDLGLDYWSRYPGLVDRVPLDDVTAAARRLFKLDSAVTLTVGPEAHP